MSPDGRTAAIGMDDSEIAIVDLSSRLLLTELDLPESDIVPVVAFSPDGSTLAATVSVLSVHTWDRSYWERDIDTLRQVICPTVGRNLTQTEWSTYLPNEPYRPICPEQA